ncbi:LIMLP_16025 family protein [Leptospira terpstrae]|uniref:LIMLP_16025 family protein n=1 Tax=Leptospira terpstrae TaxID=293075 RepID=UPI003CFE7172
MSNVENKLQDIVNAGIGAVKTSKEVWEKLVVDLNEKKSKFETNFQKLKEQGESDTSDNALKVKMGIAWGIVRFDELKDNVVRYLDKVKEGNETKPS